MAQEYIDIYTVRYTLDSIKKESTLIKIKSEILHLGKAISLRSEDTLIISDMY